MASNRSINPQQKKKNNKKILFVGTVENMEDDFPFLVNPEFDDFDWDTPINEQSWYTPSTEMDLDRDVPDIVFEPEYLGER